MDIIHTIKYQQIVSPTTVNLFSVQFLSSAIGYVAGEHGQVFKTNNSGINWTSISLGQDEPVLKIIFLNPSTGFASTNQNIYRTLNGGANWAIVSTFTMAINDIYFPTSSIGYATGQAAGSIILKTTDQGKTWFDISPPAILQAGYAVRFLNKDTGYVCGTQQTIYRTKDGGNNWFVLFNASSPFNNFRDMSINSYDNLTITGDKGYIANHQGYSASRMLFNYNYDLKGMDTKSGRSVIVGQNSVMLPYTDSKTGSTLWQYMLEPDGTTFPFNYNSVSIADANSFFSVGDQGVITRFTYPEII